MASILRLVPARAAQSALFLATLSLAACGGGGGASGGQTIVTPPAPDPFASVAEFLTIDVDNLPVYANAPFPAHYDAQVFATFDNTPADNPITDAGATLGRVLFYDKRLSINDKVACASCHKQGFAFSDPKPLSVGFDGVGLTGAHAMRLANARFYPGIEFFWNRRAATLEEQTTQPIQNSVEMGFDASHGGLDALFAKMDALPYYPELFTLVYGDPLITEDRVQKSIAQFVRSIASTDSAWDRAYAAVYDPAAPNKGLGLPFPAFTAEENQGKQLFMSPPNQGGVGCAGCHAPPTFALVANSRSNGLDAGETTIFKSPSLKNVGATGPYMHDGRFATLTDVVEHYNSGVQMGPALDNRLRTPLGQPRLLNLTSAQKAALVAFLETLTDFTNPTDSRFTSPFR